MARTTRRPSYRKSRRWNPSISHADRMVMADIKRGKHSLDIDADVEIALKEGMLSPAVAAKARAFLRKMTKARKSTKRSSSSYNKRALAAIKRGKHSSAVHTLLRDLLAEGLLTGAAASKARRFISSKRKVARKPVRKAKRKVARKPAKKSVRKSWVRKQKKAELRARRKARWYQQQFKKGRRFNPRRR